MSTSLRPYIRDLDLQCRELVETWVLIEATALEERVFTQLETWSLHTDPLEDTAAILRLTLLSAWELHPLPSRLERQLQELQGGSELAVALHATWKILPHRLVEDNWTLVRKAAGRFHIPTQKENESEFQELLSVGREAIFIAAQKFYRRPRGVFKNFAWNILREKMRDEQGRRHPVPGKIRKKLFRLGKLRDEFRMADRVLDRHEIQSRLRLAPEELHELLQVESVWGNGLEFETDVVLEELEAPDLGLDQLSMLLEIEDATRLEQALEAIEEPGRSIINKLYFQEMSLREVAEEMDLSLPAFKKVHKRALAEMKRYLEVS